MKTNAIVRIILFSLAILVLLGILIAGLAFRHYSFNFRSFPGYIRGNSAENGGTVSQSGSVEASLVHNIEIDWAAGSITVQPGDTDKIIFSETEVREENLKMVWKQSGDKLVIQFCKDNFNWNGFNFGSDLSKDLIVTVPRDWNCKELDLDAASAKVKVSELTIEKVDMDTASGICTFENCNVDEIDFDFTKISKIIVVAPCENNTTKAADIVIPIKTWLEKDGSFVNAMGTCQEFVSIVESDTLSEIEVIGKLNS